MMYSMHEVQQLVDEHHNGLLRDAARESLRRQLRAASRQEVQARTEGSVWALLAALPLPRRMRRPAAARG
jgi:hypothetical protein